MQHEELYKNFEPKVKEFAKYQGFIAKTQAQSGKFKPAVVEKLVKKHTDAAMVVVEGLMPMLMDVEEALLELTTERDTIGEGRSDHQFNLDVLKLELTIEQITKKEFEASSKETKAEIDGIDGKLEGIEDELGKFQGLMDTWNDLATKAGILE